MKSSEIHQRIRAQRLGARKVFDTKAEQILRRSLESGENEWMIWCAAANHPNLPSHFFGPLLQTEEFTVLLSLVRSLRAPREIIERIAALPVEPTFNLDDRWKEIRSIAVERLQTRYD